MTINEIHQYVNGLPQYQFGAMPSSNNTPKNGLYFMFERGEIFGEYKRIVRVGSHTGEGNLINRVNEHFTKENKDRSIFRKNVGLSILNSRRDKYLDVWNMDFTTRDKRRIYGHLMDSVYQADVESEVSNYIRNNTSFALLRCPDSVNPTDWEKKLIATLSQGRSFLTPSLGWLGRACPKHQISSAGLWQIHHLKGQVINSTEWKEIQVLASA